MLTDSDVGVRARWVGPRPALFHGKRRALLQGRDVCADAGRLSWQQQQRRPCSSHVEDAKEERSIEGRHGAKVKSVRNPPPYNH